MLKRSERLKKFFMISVIFLVCATSVLYCCNKSFIEPDFKIVSLSPAMTEILFALNAEDNIVGVTTFCNYPEQAKRIYKIGDFSNPSIERIVGLKPNLVIVNLPEQIRIKKQLEALQINVFVSSPKSLNDIYREIAEIGKMLKKKATAESLIRSMQMNIRLFESNEKKRVYIELSPRPIVTIGAHSFLNEMLEMIGGKNIFSDIAQDYPVVSQEEIIKRNPEIIILLHPEDIKDRLGWDKIAAIRNGKVYTDINQDHIMRPGPRLVKGFKALRSIIFE